jgi:hypothetical protein
MKPKPMKIQNQKDILTNLEEKAICLMLYRYNYLDENKAFVLYLNKKKLFELGA